MADRHRGRRHLLATVLIACALVLSAACGDDDDTSNECDDSDCGPAAPYTTTVLFDIGEGENMPLLNVEIADTPEERSVGLMNRESLPEDAGMLFIFEEDTTNGFWMKNTLIPLSIAFIDSDSQIIDIQDMEPLDETLHSPGEPYRYAVEANEGWFEEMEVEAGDELIGPVTPGPNS